MQVDLLEYTMGPDPWTRAYLAEVQSVFYAQGYNLWTSPLIWSVYINVHVVPTRCKHVVYCVTCVTGMQLCSNLMVSVDHLNKTLGLSMHKRVFIVYMAII